jgi:hypothetical protein
MLAFNQSTLLQSLLLGSGAVVRRRPGFPASADVAQPVEHLFCKQVVRGSSPLVSSLTSHPPTPTVILPGGEPPDPQRGSLRSPRARFARFVAAHGLLAGGRGLRVARAGVVGGAEAVPRGYHGKSTLIPEGCPSGQREQTVNLPAHAFVGSNPTPSTRARNWFGTSAVSVTNGGKWPATKRGAKHATPQAGVAQLVERQPSKLNVAGSSPVSRSRKPTTHRFMHLPT